MTDKPLTNEQLFKVFTKLGEITNPRPKAPFIARYFDFIPIMIVVVIILLSHTGCAVLLTGYLVGDAMQRNKATEACRANLRTTNEARIKEGKDIFPDQCGQ